MHDQPDADQYEDRLLVLAPTAEDAALSNTIIGDAGIVCCVCRDVTDLAREMEIGAAAILLTEGLVATGKPGELVSTIARQPEWSDIPVLLLAGGGAEAPAAVWLMESLGNVTVLDRPVRIITLISAIRSAIKARHRQYQVRDQIKTIQRAQDSLQDEARRKDEFLATLAHELRNPLAPISNAVHLLQHAAAPPEQREAATEILARQVAHMVRLVDDLLDLSRITRGVVELRWADVDLASAVQAAVDAAGSLITGGRHELILQLPPVPVVIEADSVRLTQILTNLLNNAAKYTTQPGTILVRCAILPTAGPPAEVEVRVLDTGAGIPGDMLLRVFDMFTQAPHTRNNAHGGLGIGLTLVRRLIELHHGTIEARSEGPGRGSEFVVRLPVRQPRSAEVRPLGVRAPDHSPLPSPPESAAPPTRRRTAS